MHIAATMYMYMYIKDVFALLVHSANETKLYCVDTKRDGRKLFRKFPLIILLPAYHDIVQSFSELYTEYF